MGRKRCDANKLKCQIRVSGQDTNLMSGHVVERVVVRDVINGVKALAEIGKQAEKILRELQEDKIPTSPLVWLDKKNRILQTALFESNTPVIRKEQLCGLSFSVSFTEPTISITDDYRVVWAKLQLSGSGYTYTARRAKTTRRDFHNQELAHIHAVVSKYGSSSDGGIPNNRQLVGSASRIILREIGVRSVAGSSPGVRMARYMIQQWLIESGLLSLWAEEAKHCHKAVLGKAIKEIGWGVDHVTNIMES